MVETVRDYDLPGELPLTEQAVADYVELSLIHISPQARSRETLSSMRFKLSAMEIMPDK